MKYECTWYLNFWTASSPHCDLVPDHGSVKQMLVLWCVESLQDDRCPGQIIDGQ